MININTCVIISIIVDKMEGNKKDNTIYYQERQHHRQQLRQHIKPETIDMLEINHNPSLVTRKACESVYQDQLEREIAARNILKERTTHYGDSLSNYADQGLTNKAKSNSIYKDTGMRERENQFRDYYVEKDTKVKDHIDHNYDGGSSFFRASEQHEYLRKKYQMETTETLKAQMNSKMQEVNNDKDRREKELQIRQEQLTRLKFIADIEKK